VINRGVRRARLFDHSGDYQSFLDTMREAHDRVQLRILAYCIMPNHFHLVVWPRTDTELREFVWWLTGTHSKRWHACRGSTGTGPVYQGRFKAIPVQEDGHLITVLRYVERNPLAARLVDCAEDWRWSSLFQRCRNGNAVPLEPWPILQPPDWLALVNSPEPTGEIEEVRKAVRGGVPFGTEAWRQNAAAQLGLPADVPRTGRPKKGRTTLRGAFQFGFPD
jgi:putative transposase